MSNIRYENSVLNSNEYNESALILKSRPRMLFLELTRNCNLHCSMCRPYNWYRSDWYMADDVLDIIRNQLFPYIEMVDLRGFGESTLDDRLIILADELRESGIKTQLYSNLNAQDELYWKRLVKTGINIAVSIETAIPSKYEAIRRGGNFERMKKNLIAAVSSSNPLVNEVFFSVVLSEDNLFEIDELIKFARECGIKRIQLNPISKNVNNTCFYGFEDVSIKENFSVFINISEVAKKEQVTVEIAANLFNECDLLKSHCIHPWSYVFVRYDGSVGFCDHLARVNESIIGNVLEKDFMDIWNSEQYIQLRKDHSLARFEALNKKGIECEWCKKNRYGNNEYLFENDEVPISLDDYIKKVIAK